MSYTSNINKIQELSVEYPYSAPTLIFENDYSIVQPFYQYFFPPTYLSPQSWGLQERMTEKQKDELYNLLLQSVDMSDSDILFDIFPMNHIKLIKDMGLSDASFVADRRKGFSQRKNRETNGNPEHKITSLSRRLRDSFAHGRIADCDEFILFEDKANIQITGRIVLKKDDLLLWKSIIENYTKENELL